MQRIVCGISPFSFFAPYLAFKQKMGEKKIEAILKQFLLKTIKFPGNACNLSTYLL